MDYYATKRKQLQSLCKQHGIPANLRNTEMAHKLTLLLKEDEKLSEPVCKNLEENEGGIDSEVETKKVKKVKFSPENQTFYFVGTDNDSNSDCDYNPKKKQGRKRKSMVVKKVQVFEISRGLEHSHKIIDSPGRVTRSRAQKMDEGNAEAVFSPLPGKKKLTNRVKKVDSCDKPPPEVELIERVDSNAEHANSNGGLIQRQLRSRVVVSGDGGNSLVLRKNLVPRGSKKPKQNKGSDGDLLPTETYEENVPVEKGIKPEKVQKQCKGNVTKVEGSSVLSEKLGKTDLGGSRITRSRTQVGGNSSGVESKTDILEVQEKGQEVLQLEETCKGLDRKHLRRKSAVPLKRSLEGDNLANEAVVPGKTLRRSKRNLARDRDSASGPLAETKLVGRSEKSKTKFMGKPSGQEECELEEPSKDGQKIPVFQKGKELAKGDTRKRPRNIDLERASKVESSVERMEENVALLPNGPLRRSRRITTLFSSAAHDDREFRICEAAGTVKQSTAAGTVKQPVPDKGTNVSQSLRRSSRNACEKILTEATGDMCGIANGVKKDGLVKQIQEPTYEKESSLIVHDSLNKSPQRRSSRILSKSGLVAPTGRTGIAAGKNKKSESRMPIIKEKVSFAKINSPLEENPSIDIRLNIPEASGNGNNTDSFCSKGLERSSKQRKGSSKQRKGSSKQRKGSSKKRESAGRGQPVYDEVSTAYSIMEKAMDISGHLKDNQISESMKFQGISTVQKPQNVTEPLTNEMENSIPDNTTACDMDYHSYLSLNKGHTGHAIAVEQNPVECPDKFGNVVSSKVTCPSDGHSPTYQPDCEGECSNLLDLKNGLETDESLTVKTSNQRIDVVDDQLEGGSKVSVPEDQNLVQLDASGIDQPVLVEQVLEDHLTELGENKESDSNNAKSSELVEEICAFSSCDREETVQVDVGSTAETSAETDGDIHLGRIVLSDTAVTLSKSSLVKEATDSCCSKEAVEKSSNKWESAAMDQLSKYNNLQGIFTVQNAQNVMEPVTNVMENVMVDSGLNVPENATVRDMEDNYYPSLDRGDSGHIIAVEQTSEECLDKLSNVGFSRLTCLGDGHSPTCQPGCEGECTNLLDLKGLETDESWTVKTSHQRSDVVDDQLEDGSKASVPEDHNLVQLDARGINQPVLVEPVVEDHLTERDENNESDRNTAKSSEVVEETSEETVGDIHLDRIVPSDTAVTPPKSSLLKQEGDQLENQFKSPVEGGIIRERDEALLHGSQNQNLSFDEVDILEKHTVAANDIGSSMDALVDETQSGSLSDFALAKMQLGNENKSPGPSNMVLPVDSEVQEKASNEVIQSVLQPDPAKCGDLELQGNEFGVPERVSGVKVVESLNVGINRTRTSQETEEVIDLLNLNDRDVISGDSKESPGFENLHPISMVKPETGVDCSADSPATDSSHGQCLLHQGEEATAETKALELNAASPLFSSYGIKKLFSDDKIDGFSKSYPDMSKVDSVIEDSEDVKKGKESAVGIAQVAAGQLTDHEHKSEEVMELKSTLEMGIHYPVGSPVTNFSSCGDIERDEFQKLDAGLSKASLMNEVGEHVKEGIENDLGIAQVVAKQHSDHGQRMADELLKSTHPPVSDGNTCVNEGPKEKGIRPINQVFVDHEDIDEAGDIEYSNVWARTGKSVDDSEMSGSNPGAFDAPIDVPAANSDPNYLMQARSNVNPDIDDTKFSVESEIVSEQNVTADQCPISADSILRKDNLESPWVRSWEADSDKSISISFAPRENKTDSLVPSPPKSFVNTVDMKENFRNTKSDKVSNPAVKTLQPRPALKDLQKK
ncbi:unnamed protein product [Prunus armeniaca]